MVRVRRVVAKSHAVTLSLTQIAVRVVEGPLSSLPLLDAGAERGRTGEKG